MNYWISLTKHFHFRKLAASCVLLSGFALHAADFGVADWGMTAEQIKNLETRPNLTPFLEQNYLIYQVEIAGIEQARLVYQLQGNQLIEGRFIFSSATPKDAAQALSQYKTVKAMMSNQFGPANIDQTLYAVEPEMQLAPADMANELASDRLILKSSWRSNSATINHQLAWNVDRAHHQLHYIPALSVQPQPASNAF